MTAVSRREALVHALADDAGHVIEGCTLPPKVSGVSRGAVLLSVPHIVPVEVGSSCSIPRSSLVRLRWWGEDRPGSSLFRPTRVVKGAPQVRRSAEVEQKREDDASDDEDDQDIGASSLKMKYAVCVPARQLLEYLRDMRELVFDVTDRETRKKYGRATLPFRMDASASDDEALRSFNQSNVRCEIHSVTGNRAIVGYLVANMEVEWSQEVVPAMTPLKWVKSEPSVSVKSSGLDLLMAGRHQTGGSPWTTRDREQPPREVQQRLSFSSISSSSSGSAALGDLLRYQRQERVMQSHRGVETHENSAPSTRDDDKLDELLKKGRELQRAMSITTADKSLPLPLTESPTISSLLGDHADIGAVLAPYEVMTEEVEDGWEKVLAEAEQIQPRQQHRDAPSRAGEARSVPAGAPHLETVSLGGFNALEMSFDRMELEQTMMERLRQLREGSVSTRFSPIQLVVSHRHPASLFTAGQPIDQRDKWIAAFAVNSSLRKRTWRANYSHTLPLIASTASTLEPIQVAQPSLRFRVRCQPQDASPLGRRRRESKHQRLDLWAELPVDDLLQHRDREWVLSLPLRVEDSQDTQPTRGKKRPAPPVGSITLKLRFRTVEEPSSDHLVDSEASGSHSGEDWASRDRGSTPDRQIIQSVASHARKTLLQPPPHPARTGVPVFFALLADKATVTVQPAASAQLTLRLEYGTPSFFGHGAKLLRLKRSAKAPLRRSTGSHQFHASIGHMNAFPVDVTDAFIDKLATGLLILELWVQEKASVHLPSHVTETLLGVAKIPLAGFQQCIADPTAVGHALAHVTPFMGVDSEFRIVDPLTDAVNGSVLVRVAFGSAEQLFNLKSTLAAAVKVQSHVRGWLTRKAIGYWRQFELVNAGQVDGEDEDGLRRSTGEEEDASPSEDGGEAATPVISTAVALDVGLSQRRRVSQAAIRVRIREAFFTASESREGIVGCEVHGQLQLRQGDYSPVSSPHFVLWWDGLDTRLNSQFQHNIQASTAHVGLQTHDMALLFRVEPQATGVRPIDAVKGAAVLDLAEVFAKTLVAGRGEAVEELDVPILWNAATDATLRRHARLPLEISLRVTTEEGEDAVVEEVGGQSSVQTLISRTEHLLPATIRLCLDFQRLCDVDELLLERVRVAELSSGERQAITRALDSGTAVVTLVATLCVGVELPDQVLGEEELVEDERGRWHRRFSFEGVTVDVAKGVQALPSTTQADVDLLVHPALVAYLQDECLPVQVQLHGDGETDRFVVGEVAVPLAAVLFRPSGVHGSFPVRVADDALGGRLGVQIYIDRDAAEGRGEGKRAASSPVQSKAQVISQASVADDAVERVDKELVEGLEEELKEEENVEDAVASIHSATSRLQHRLSRIAMQFDSSGDPAEQRAEPLEPSPRFEWVDDGDARVDTVEEEEKGGELDEGSDPLVELKADESSHSTFIANEQAQGEEGLGDRENDTAASEEDGANEERDGGVDEDGMFKPLTLASFGIEEMEFSPLESAASPTVFTEDLHSFDNSDGESESKRLVDEPRGEKEEKEEEKEEEEEEKEEGETVAIVSGSRDDGEQAEVEVAAEEEDMDTSFNSTAASTATHLDVAASPSAAAGTTDQEEDEADEETEVDPMHEWATGVEAIATDPEGEDEKSEKDWTVALPVTTADDHSSASVVETVASIEELEGPNHQPDGDTRSDAKSGEASPQASPSVSPVAVSPPPQMCNDSWTQTEEEGDDVPSSTDDAELSVTLSPPKHDVPIPRSLADAGTETEDANGTAVEDAACQTSQDDTPATVVAPTPSETATASVSSPPPPPPPPLVPREEQRISKPDALPIDKFNIAWELLNEIRALYVHTGGVSRQPSPLSMKQEVEESKAGLGNSLFLEEELSPPPLPQRMEELRPPPVVTWDWPDESSLRAEIDDRLRGSQHEYDTALALSQSMVSSHSWSSSFHASRSSAAAVPRQKLPPLASLRPPRSSPTRFGADTETERIARIMQGSLDYWLDTDDDEEEEEEEDEE